MKRIFLFGLLVISMSAFAQQKDTAAPDLKNSIDSLTKKTKAITDSLTNRIINRQEQQTGIDMDQNIQYITDLQKKRREKQKKSAIIRIAIGVGFLILLVVGLSRKKKAAGK
ncbi:MAG TPA: hypothetical protein PLG88_01180 [Chitinophagaceae bacterium]|nr:hypothetical protein [Chitinophagaceae bacterium]